MIYFSSQLHNFDMFYDMRVSPSCRIMQITYLKLLTCSTCLRDEI